MRFASDVALLMFAAVCVVLLAGYPVAFTLAGTALLFAWIGLYCGSFDGAFLLALPNRLYGVMTNPVLIAVPLFVFMGLVLEKSRLAEQLLESLAAVFGRRPGGLGVAVILVGMLLAASTGIVGATVVTMGLLSMPTMLRQGYDNAVSAGAICAAGTLGQLIPPSIVLVLLGDVIASAYQQAQLAAGNYAPESVSVADLFAGALVPGLMLVVLYLAYLTVRAWYAPGGMPPLAATKARASPRGVELFGVLIPPLLLMVAVLGSILLGAATPTEAAAVGAVGACCLAVLRRRLDLARLRDCVRGTVEISCMVFMILIGATVFSLVFRGFGGDELVQQWLQQLPGGAGAAVLVTMVVLFALGFVLDFVEITFIVVPIVAPILLGMGLDPVWLGIMIAVNLQTSFLTPPFGFALFYLRGVAPAQVATKDIYRGVIPFVILQLVLLGLLALFPQLATWLPLRLS